MERWSHKVELDKAYKGAGYPKGARIKAVAGLVQRDGNGHAYFSVTADIYVPGRRDIEAGGCLHDDILSHWPKLAPVVALHMSSDDAQPMHAAANGWYWLAGYYGGAGESYHGSNGSSAKTPDECLKVFADHVRVSVDEARHLAKVWQRGVDYSEARLPFRQWLAQQRTRFLAEKDAAIALLDSMATPVSA